MNIFLSFSSIQLNCLSDRVTEISDDFKILKSTYLWPFNKIKLEFLKRLNLFYPLDSCFFGCHKTELSGFTTDLETLNVLYICFHLKIKPFSSNVYISQFNFRIELKISPTPLKKEQKMHAGSFKYLYRSECDNTTAFVWVTLNKVNRDGSSI